MAKYSPTPERRLERALDNPTRQGILDLLTGERGFGLGSIAEKLGISAANAGYHVGVLSACGAVELWVDEERGGERLVRLAKTPEQRKKEWLDVAGSMRDDVTPAELKSLIEIAAELRPGPAPGT